MKFLCALTLVVLSIGLAESRQIEFTNKCGYPLWVNPLTNAEGPELAPGIVRLENNGQYAYQIPDSGW